MWLMSVTRQQLREETTVEMSKGASKIVACDMLVGVLANNKIFVRQPQIKPSLFFPSEKALYKQQQKHQQNIQY